MTNLIPPAAKKQLVRAYWTRLISAWGILWAIALLIGSLLMWPTYILISGKSQAYESTVAGASERTAAYDDMSKELQKANEQAKILIKNKDVTKLSTFITDIWSVIDAEVTVDGISVGRGETTDFSPITISGEAVDRQALASFRDRVANLPYADSVDLPIGNLAANQDISFNLTVTLNETAL